MISTRHNPTWKKQMLHKMEKHVYIGKSKAPETRKVN